MKNLIHGKLWIAVTALLLILAAAASLVLPQKALAAAAGETATLEMTVYPQSVGKPNQLRNFSLDGNLAFCVQNHVEAHSGTSYTRMPVSAGDTGIYSAKAEEMFGFSAEDQKEIAVASVAYGLYKANKGLDHNFIPWNQTVTYQGTTVNLAELPETFWLAVSRYWIWYVVTGNWFHEDHPADYINHQMYVIEDYLGSGYGWDPLWYSTGILKEVVSVVRDFVMENGYPEMTWYYVPGQAEQYLVQPDVDVITRKVFDTYGQVGGTKRGSHTGNRASCSGAVYALYTDESCTTLACDRYGNEIVLTTDADGTMLSGQILVREEPYYLKELQAPEGTTCDDTVYPIYIEDGKITYAKSAGFETLVNNEWYGQICLYKKADGSGEALSGAVFTLYEWSAAESRFTDIGTLGETSQGVYESGRLYYTADNAGKYLVEETKAPTGYENSGWKQQVQIDAAPQVFTYEVVNRTSVKYQFAKVDEAGQPVAGCEFILKDSQGTVIDQWTTPESGLHEVTGLKEGEAYTLTEVKAAAGYQAAMDLVFTAEASDTPVVIRTENRKYTGSIGISKYAGGTLTGGVSFTLFTDQANGEEPVQYQEKNWYPVDTKTTDASGRVVFAGLSCHAGYMFAETASVSGSSLLTEPVVIGRIPVEAKAFPENYQGDYEQEDSTYYLYQVEYTVWDGTSFTMPFTGSSHQQLFGGTLICAAAAVTGFIGISQMKKKEKKANEEME